MTKSNDVLTRVRQAAHDLSNDPPNAIITMRALTALHEAMAEVERLYGEAEVADEQLAQLRGFAEAHKTCTGPDETTEPLSQLVDLVHDFGGYVPGDHMLRMAERAGVKVDAETWDIVRKRAGSSEGPAGDKEDAT